MTEKKPTPPVPNTFDPRLVETLGEIATRLDLSEIEVVQGELRIRVARQGGVLLAAASAGDTPDVQAASTPPSNALPADLVGAHPGAVKSPMVGTAYIRPAPETPPFVTIGSQVKAGDKILLIEAMKTFNEIVAPQAGTIIAILVEDAQPVEFGQPLVVIE